MSSHGKFGLWYNRPTRCEAIRLVDGNESDDSFRQQQYKVEEENTANRRLNALSKEVREEIDTRSWATMYLQYLTKRIYTTASVTLELTDLPKINNLSLSDKIEHPFQDLSLEIQLQILGRRLEDARVGAEAIWATLDELIIQLTSEISEYPPDSCLGFRVFDPESQARRFPSGDIRCGNWQEFDVNHDLTRAGAEEHIRYDRRPTDYISISTSPRRVWNLVHKWRSRDPKIAVIDLRVLQRLGIAYGSTTEDLNFRNIGANTNRTEYATRHHVLVVGWIPCRSVLGVLSKENFNKVLDETQIDTSREAGDIPSVEYDRKISFELISRHFKKQSVMASMHQKIEDI